MSFRAESGEGKKIGRAATCTNGRMSYACVSGQKLRHAVPRHESPPRQHLRRHPLPDAAPAIWNLHPLPEDSLNGPDQVLGLFAEDASALLRTKTATGPEGGMSNPVKRESAWRMIQPGLYVDEQGYGHLFPNEVLEEVGLPYSEENYNIVV